jgi:hypothetical protein
VDIWRKESQNSPRASNWFLNLPRRTTGLELHGLELDWVEDALMPIEKAGGLVPESADDCYTLNLVLEPKGAIAEASVQCEQATKLTGPEVPSIYALARTTQQRPQFAVHSKHSILPLKHRR